MPSEKYHPEIAALDLILPEAVVPEAVVPEAVVPEADAPAKLIAPSKLISNVIEWVYQAADSRD